MASSYPSDRVVILVAAILVIPVVIQIFRGTQGSIVIRVANFDPAVHVAYAHVRTATPHLASHLVSHKTMMRDRDAEIVRNRTRYRACLHVRFGVGG